MIQSHIPPEVLAEFQPVFRQSMARFILVGAIYIIVITLAAVFLSHRTVGPAYRIEQELRKRLESNSEPGPLKIRHGDDFEPLITTINQLIEKLRQS